MMIIIMIIKMIKINFTPRQTICHFQLPLPDYWLFDTLHSLEGLLFVVVGYGLSTKKRKFKKH